MASMGSDITRLIDILAKVPGLGPRSARRAVLHLLKKREIVMRPLAEALLNTANHIRTCHVCGNLDTSDPCTLCADPSRDQGLICVVEEVADLWAMERAGAFRGRYHVLGGVLSALDGIRPEDLRIGGLVQRVAQGSVREVILATNSTVDGQTTAHYLVEALAPMKVPVSRLSSGLPMGGELDHLDDGTIHAALAQRRPF